MKAMRSFFWLALFVGLTSFDNPKIKAYIKTQVMPVLKAQRAKLEVQLSEPDKLRLIELRKELKMGAEMRKIQHQGEKEKLFLEASAMAYRYFEQIKPLLDELKVQREQWRKDIEALLGQQKKSQPRAMGRWMSAVGFLLLDPSPQFESHDLGLTVFPNPSSGQTFVAYELSKETHLKIEIIGTGGELLQSFDLNQSAGKHSLSLNLTSGIYMIKLNDGSRVQTRRLVVK